MSSVVNLAVKLVSQFVFVLILPDYTYIYIDV